MNLNFQPTSTLSFFSNPCSIAPEKKNSVKLVFAQKLVPRRESLNVDQKKNDGKKNGKVNDFNEILR